jgi:hypothetical protein
MAGSRTVVAVLFALLMLLSAPGSIGEGGDVGIMQADTEQPSHENNTFNLWGRENAEPCWGHFGGTDGGSAPDGYAEKAQSNGKMEIEWTCRMDPPLKEDFALEEGLDIRIHLMIDISGDWENGQGGCNGDCENLNISLMRGSMPAATVEYSSLTDGENEVVVNIPVDENLTVWDKNTDNPGIRVKMVLYATTGIGCGFIFNCDAEFRMYYAGQDDSTFNGTATFPIMNESAAEEILGNDDPANDDEETPGFGILAGASALGLAAAWAGRRED